MTRWSGRRVLALAGLLVLAAVAAVAAVALLGSRAEKEPPPDAVAGGPVTVLAVGDIARCSSENDEATAELVEAVPDANLLALGDIAYNNGSARNFAECYDPSWGPFLERTRPVPGNHEYRTNAAAPYFDYFGHRAGEPGRGWYSFDLGDWHLVALNSNCGDVGCDEGSEQVRWLEADLAQNDARCTLAFWHHPRFTSGARHGGTDDVEVLWQLLVDDGVEVLLSGHEHLYERTAPLDGDGQVDEANGVRQFVVGTGGGSFYEGGERIPGSEAAFTRGNGGVPR